MSGKIPAHEIRGIPCRSIWISPSNVGDKRVVKIKCCQNWGTEASGACPQNALRRRLMTSKSTFSPEESKSRILRGYCGGRSINGPVGFGIDSGVRGLRPIQGRVPIRGHHTPRQCASEDDRVRGRLGRGLTAIRS